MRHGKVTNRLGADIAELYVLGGDFQKTYSCESLVDGGNMTLKKLPSGELNAMLQDVCGKTCLTPPEGVEPDEIHSYGNFGRRYYGYYNRSTDNDPENCVAERILSPTSSFNTTAGKSGVKRYYAILREPYDIPAGISKVQWVQAVHIIVGEW